MLVKIDPNWEGGKLRNCTEICATMQSDVAMTLYYIVPRYILHSSVEKDLVHCAYRNRASCSRKFISVAVLARRKNWLYMKSRDYTGAYEIPKLNKCASI